MKSISRQIEEAVRSGKKGFVVDGSIDDMFPYNLMIDGKIVRRTKVSHHKPGVRRAWYRVGKGKHAREK